MKQRVLVSVSGGRSSALMAKMIWDTYRDSHELLFVFANTSREKEETLVFLDQLDKIWGLPIVWIEAVVHHGLKKASTHIVTSFENAKRKGEVFEEVIKKYGIPNRKFLHCTRELKTKPIWSYARSIGWGDFTKYITAIGYRRDEPKRVNILTCTEKRQWYPLFEWDIKKPDVAFFFNRNSFDLQLEDWEGNCDLCHKKSKRKLLTRIKQDIESTIWHQKMESMYDQVKPEKMKFDKTPCRFFRDGESIHDLIEQSIDFTNLAIDLSRIEIGSDFPFDIDLDEQEDCSESCEPFGA
jgi:3'-phosphoadenosine 5'-phosphosulfate sulfotransferase (PAPS reductase)/FAD synthetase